MKVVLYFRPETESAARKVMGAARAKGVSVHWAGATEFTAPRDVERVDEVWVLQSESAIEAAYGDAGTKVVNKGARPKTETRKSVKTVRPASASTDENSDD